MGNKFDDYLKGKLTATQFEEGLRELFGSPHRRTKVLANPKIATHSELLDLAAMLDTTSLSIYLDFEVGKDSLTANEVQQLEFVFVTVAPDKEKAMKYIEGKQAAMAA